MSSEALVPRHSAITPSCRTIVRTPSSVEPYACTLLVDACAALVAADLTAALCALGWAVGQAYVGQLVMAHRLQHRTKGRHLTVLL